MNGGKLVDPIIIDRIQDSEGKTIINNENRSCTNCDQISYLSDDYPKIRDDYNKFFHLKQLTKLLLC